MFKKVTIFLLVSLSLNSCLLFKSLDKALEDTVVRLENRYDGFNIDSAAKQLTANLTRGVTDELASDSSKANINAALANVLQQFSDSLSTIVSTTKGDLLNAETDSLLNARIENLSNALKTQISEIVGGTLNKEINGLVEGIITQITSQQTIAKLNTLRDSVLGEDLRALTDSIVRGAISTAIDEFAKGYDEKLKDRLDGALTRVEEVEENISRDLERLLFIAGLVLIAVIAAWFYFRGKKNRDTLKVVTKEIDKTKSRKQYDDLVGRIKQKTEEQGLTNHFNTVLKEDSLYQQEHWKDKNRQLLDIITNSMQNADHHHTKQQMTDSIAAKAAELGLEEDIHDLVSSNKKSEEDTE